MVPLWAYLLLSAFLFMVGVVGVATRRNALIIFMAIELMLNAVNLTFVAPGGPRTASMPSWGASGRPPRW